MSEEREEGSSENHMINNLKVIIDFAKYIGHNSFHDINKKEQILSYLNGKIKDPQLSPDKRWITTWNHFLNRIKLFFRRIHNYHLQHQLQVSSIEERTNWINLDFIKIKQNLNVLVHILKLKYGNVMGY